MFLVLFYKYFFKKNDSKLLLQLPNLLFEIGQRELNRKISKIPKTNNLTE